MRKSFRIIAVTAAALAATTLTAHAQGAKSFGIIGGVNFSSFTGSDADGGTYDLGGGDSYTATKGSLTGFTGGLYVSIPIGTSVVFEPELLYSGKGAKYSYEASIGGSSQDFGAVTYHGDYLSIPLLIRYNFNAQGGPYVLGGVSANFNVSCSTDVSSTIESALEDFGADTSPGCAYFNIEAATPDEVWIPLKANTTFGGVIGIGFQKDRFGLEGRYDFDFNDAVEFDYSGAPSLNVKNAAWEILARIMIK